MKRHVASTVFLLGILALLGAAPASADCSGQFCSDCKQNTRGVASCWSVNYTANCSCSINVQTPGFCILEGACTYTGGGGGGGVGGGSGGGGGCARTPGSWCPSECESCQTVIWY
jgi:hypothetical protein